MMTPIYISLVLTKSYGDVLPTLSSEGLSLPAMGELVGVIFQAKKLLQRFFNVVFIGQHSLKMVSSFARLARLSKY